MRRQRIPEQGNCHPDACRRCPVQCTAVADDTTEHEDNDAQLTVRCRLCLILRLANLPPAPGTGSRRCAGIPGIPEPPGCRHHSPFRCGDLLLGVDFDNAAETATLSWSGHRRVLPQAVAASGARYADDAGNDLNKGDAATLTWPASRAGAPPTRYRPDEPAHAASPSAASAPNRAGWRSMAARPLARTDYGERNVEASGPMPPGRFACRDHRRRHRCVLAILRATQRRHERPDLPASIELTVGDQAFAVAAPTRPLTRFTRHATMRRTCPAHPRRRHTDPLETPSALSLLLVVAPAAGCGQHPLPDHAPPLSRRPAPRRARTHAACGSASCRPKRARCCNASPAARAHPHRQDGTVPESRRSAAATARLLPRIHRRDPGAQPSRRAPDRHRRATALGLLLHGAITTAFRCFDPPKDRPHDRIRLIRACRPVPRRCMPPASELACRSPRATQACTRPRSTPPLPRQADAVAAHAMALEFGRHGPQLGRVVDEGARPVAGSGAERACIAVRRCRRPARSSPADYDTLPSILQEAVSSGPQRHPAGVHRAAGR